MADNECEGKNAAADKGAEDGVSTAGNGPGNGNASDKKEEGAGGSKASPDGPTNAWGPEVMRTSNPDPKTKQAASSTLDPTTAMAAISAAAVGRGGKTKKPNAKASKPQAASSGVNTNGANAATRPASSVVQRPATTAWGGEVVGSTADLEEKIVEAKRLIAINEQTYAKYYECARGPANACSVGEQGNQTPFQKDTMEKWANGGVQLVHPPTFIIATLTSPGQAAVQDYHRNHLTWNVYGVLPPGSVLPNANPRRYVFNVLYKAARSDDERMRLDRIFLLADSWNCSATSMIWILCFHKKQLRDVWDGASFRYGSPKQSVTLKATDSFTTPVPRQGLDAAARELCYPIYLLEQPDLTYSEVVDIGSMAAGTEVLGVTEVKSTSTMFQQHKWKIFYRQLDCPALLVNIRRLQIKRGAVTSQIFVQHPRVTDKCFPCGKCLSIFNDTTDCKNVHHDVGWESHSREIELEPKGDVFKLTDLSAKLELKRQMKEMRARLAPQLQQRIDEELAKANREKAKEVVKAAAHAARQQEKVDRQTVAAIALEKKRINQEADARLLAHLKQLQQRAARSEDASSNADASHENGSAEPVASSPTLEEANPQPTEQKTSQPGSTQQVLDVSTAIGKAVQVSVAESAAMAPSVETPTCAESEKIKSDVHSAVDTAKVEEAVRNSDCSVGEIRGRRTERRGSVKQTTTNAVLNPSGTGRATLGDKQKAAQKAARKNSYSPRRKAVTPSAARYTVGDSQQDGGDHREAKSESQEPPDWTVKGWTAKELAEMEARKHASLAPTTASNETQNAEKEAIVNEPKIANLLDPAPTTAPEPSGGNALVVDLTTASQEEATAPNRTRVKPKLQIDTSAPSLSSREVPSLLRRCRDPSGLRRHQNHAHLEVGRSRT